MTHHHYTLAEHAVNVCVLLVFAAVMACATVWLEDRAIRRWEKQGYKKCSCPCGQHTHWRKP